MSGEQKIITITHIAEQLNVSPGTVSSVLNGQSKQRRISPKTEARILKLASELQYLPNELARSLRRKRSGIIGAVFGTLMHNWAHRTLLGMHEVLSAEQYFPFLTVSYWNTEIEAHEFSLLMQRRVEGFICVPTPGGGPTYHKAIAQKFPFVFLNDVPLDMPTANYITWDAEHATRMAIRHLIECGYRRIALIGSDHQTLMTQARFKAYIETLLEAGLEINQRWIAWIPVMTDFDATMHQILQTLFIESSYQPDCVFFTVDSYAMKGLKFFKSHGIRVPEDVGIVGMGDLEGLDDMDVGLTTMHEPLEEMGRKAAEVVLQLIREPASEPLQHIIECDQLIVRRSTRQCA